MIEYIKTFYEKNKKLAELFLYAVVGGIATVTEWVIFYLFDKIGINYYIATVIAYIISTFVNWLAGRILVFKKSKNSILVEISEIYLASVIGLGLNLVLMWLFVEKIFIDTMISKIIATVIVFTFNFLIRKLWIYKK